MSQKVKRAEFEVTAESERGLERGLNMAMRKIEEGNSVGEYIIEKHGIFVKWNVFDLTMPTQTPESIFAGGRPESEPQPEPVSLPDIAVMDIEEAKGVVGTAGTLEELATLMEIESKGDRTPGGRRGVLSYIEKRWKEIEKKLSDSKEA